MASMAFRIYEKQKDYQSEYGILADKFTKLETEKAKLEEDLNATRRTLSISMELCRSQDIKVIGLQRTVGHLHARIASLEQTIQAIRE
eukprot:6284632-Amphidinium_carterae.1